MKGAYASAKNVARLVKKADTMLPSVPDQEEINSSPDVSEKEMITKKSKKKSGKIKESKRT